ncbi:hypothetical protein STXM2123_15 [Streptomyces sp. F-3]|nr:hypothetical protein STXM2123_15 [Streptomyces sp. F-3]
MPHADATGPERAPSRHAPGTARAFLGTEPTNQDHLPMDSGQTVGNRCEDAFQN